MHKLVLLAILALGYFSTRAQPDIPRVEHPVFKAYPEVSDVRPDLPSPFQNAEGEEFVVARTINGAFAVFQVTPTNEYGICQQKVVDTADFPALVHTGLHDPAALESKTHITGWSVDTISQLARPGNLSSGGFMAADENILSVMLHDNAYVKRMGFTHPQLAKPLFHVLNMMDADLDLNRWNMAKHQWEHIQKFWYAGNTVHVIAYDTKGGQKSIFNDGLQGVFHIQLWHVFTPAENEFIDRHYHHLSQQQKEELKARLGFINTGELEPQYIMRYGFYEGHTFWRADPIAIAFIFGLKSLEELHRIFDGDLYSALTEHFI